MDTELIAICALTGVINLIGALAYAARIAGVRTGRIALSFALFNVLLLVSRTSNGFLGPFLAKRIETGLANGAGDALLRELAQRWRSVLPQGDGIAYMGADEFCVVMPSIADELQARQRAELLQDAMRDAIWIDGARLAASAFYQ